MKNILIIGAHFDDAELGAGGAAAKLVAAGKNVYKITLTDNVTHFEHRNVNVDFESSKMQSNQACAVLGIKELSFQTEECSRLAYSKDIMQRVESIIFEYDIDTAISDFGATDTVKICIANYSADYTSGMNVNIDVYVGAIYATVS